MNIKTAEKVAILLCIPRVAGSNLGPDTSYFDWVNCFSSVPPVTSGNVPHIRQPLFHYFYNSFINYPVIQHCIV
jgi:hypothetical protein